MANQSPIDVFIAYTKADKTLLDRLRIQLTAVERIGLVDAWDDSEIEVGSDREAAIQKAMNEAEIILLLVSADFIASEFSYEQEIKKAMELHQQQKAIVVPVLLKECSWQYTPFAQLQVLPRNQVPATNQQWQSPDNAFQEVVQEVVRISNKMRTGQSFEQIQQDPVKHKKETIQKTITVNKTIQKPTSTITAESGSNWFKYLMIGLSIIGLGAIFLMGIRDGQDDKTPPPLQPNSGLERVQDTPTNPTAKADLPSILINDLRWSAENISTASPQGSWCPGNEQVNCEKYGRLYFFEQAQNICPSGWRLPTKAEWAAITAQDIQQLGLTKTGVFDKTPRDFNRKAYYWSGEKAMADESWCFEFMNPETARVERRYRYWALACRCVTEAN